MPQRTGARSKDRWNDDTPREYHLWELPEKLRVQLEPGVMKDLVDRAAENVGGITQLAHRLEKDPIMVI